MQLKLGDRRRAVEKLRAKYETLAKGFAGAGTGGADGGGEGFETGGSSQAYFIIAAAQKREELQREGDELDQEIRRCEREIRALESTLRHLNARNVDFRVSFQRADPGSSDADALRSLEARAKAAQDGLFRRKKELQRAQTDHEEDLARLNGAKARAARLDEQNAQLESVQAQASAQLHAQKETLGTAASRLARLRNSHRKAGVGVGEGCGGDKTMIPTVDLPFPMAGGTTTVDKAGGQQGAGRGDDEGGSDTSVAVITRGGETLTEKALRAGALRDTAAGVLYTLGQLAREFPEMHDALNTGLHKRRLRIPPTPPAYGPASASGSTAGGMRSNGRIHGSSSGAGGSRPGSDHSSQGQLSARSSRSGGGGRGGSLGDRRRSKGGGGSVTRDGISPMRVFDVPI